MWSGSVYARVQLESVLGSTSAPRPVENDFFKNGPGPFESNVRGRLGPVLTNLQPFAAVGDRLSPVSLVYLGTAMDSNMGPKPVGKNFFHKWPGGPREGQTDLSGPFGACFDQF